MSGKLGVLKRDEQVRSLIALAMLFCWHADLAAQVVIESQERSVHAHASWVCCPEWPPGQQCRVDSLTLQYAAVGFEEFYVPVSATLRCWLDNRSFIQLPAAATHRSTLDGARFTAYESVIAGTDGTVHCVTRFRVSFLVLEACSVRVTATAAIYWVSPSFRSEISLIGENVRLEFRPECCGTEQQRFQETALLTPGRYEAVALLEVGPVGGGDALLDFEAVFSPPTNVHQKTWSGIKRLYGHENAYSAHW